MSQESVKLIYEDEYCLVVSKPSNLIVHHSYYARNIEETSLTDLIREQGCLEACPVHRLDRKTSGLILFAKKAEWVADFQKLFENGEIEKKYLALLRGHLEAEGSIDSPVKNDRGNYKDALTKYTCLEHFERAYVIPPYEKQRYSLVELTPITGRMHQLRIHANKIAHPIINDPKYGNRHHNHYFQEVLGIHELFLHAQSLKFKQPFTGELVWLQEPFPDFWNRFLIP
ncbi:RluA family pseudouridine synthase [Fluviicola taffensis]|uniref:Pseudouridine synthase n=1 Tax=Fluviicola taffensis (strain DSM 16823 / NCIMB 13979 / RW262) TaxID=755732 RepID=F2IAN4_FLUTR|nr:pseudouridine synthase [Fluviicola taffensis]AEA44189.1 pseudouridine synthase [Fluviicola taffensis DSM 16823]